jgi:hypothetical protein
VTWCAGGQPLPGEGVGGRLAAAVTGNSGEELIAGGVFD